MGFGPGFGGVSLFPMAIMLMILIKETWTSMTNLLSGRAFQFFFSQWEARAADAQNDEVYLEFTVRSDHVPEVVSVLGESAAPTAEVDAIMASLPVIPYRQMAKISAGDDDAHCTVCLYSFTSEDNVRQAPRCSHVFHKHCLDGWMAHHHMTCPLCRSILVPNDRPEQFGAGSIGQNE